MRMYGSVHISFWENSETQNLSDQAKLLAIYLLTGPHTNMAGVFRLPDGYIKEDLGWGIEAVQKAFQELSQIDFLTRDEERGWLVIHQFLKWNPVQNINQGVAIRKIFHMIPTQSSVFKPFVNGLLEYGTHVSKEFLNGLRDSGNGFETVFSDGATEQEQEQNQDQKQNNNFMSDSENPTACKKQSHHSQAVEVLQFLNEKTGRAYRPVEANLKLIIARLKSGATPTECYQVIAKKSREWGGHKDMDQYLRPATLFNATKFEQYVGELVATDVSKVTA
ncbi:MAG TPA: conserved phage C-terminal domain-containing protein [Gammaproteobacteria bacterium]|nr:conserved phage C-terminal domain-containing protein [Gammaproteobacteria bacterium]